MYPGADLRDRRGIPEWKLRYEGEKYFSYITENTIRACGRKNSICRNSRQSAWPSVINDFKMGDRERIGGFQHGEALTRELRVSVAEPLSGVWGKTAKKWETLSFCAYVTKRTAHFGLSISDNNIHMEEFIWCDPFVTDYLSRI